jgi:hypothetical protein
MTQHTTSRRTTFSATTSWVGVLLLGAGLTQIALPTSEASSPGPQTASIEFQDFDDFFGILSGGQQRDFPTGVYGWQGPAFESLGMMGIEWTTSTGTYARSEISPDPGTASPSPGGDSSWTTPGYLSANPNNQIFTQKTISLSGNQARFSMRHRSLGDESAINRRLYWVAELASGYNPVYVGAGTPTLLITDATGAHPSVIIHVTSVAGSPIFAGATSLYTPLLDGDSSPTLYLAPGSATDFTMEITVGIIDADPCSTSSASSFASSNAGTFGAVWESLTSCAEDAQWTVTADDDASAPLPLTFSSPYQAPAEPTTRTLGISGLPDGVTWERVADSGNSLQVTLRATSATEDGTYELTWSSQDLRDDGGVLTFSRPSLSRATLTVVTAPPPPLVVEPLEAVVPAPSSSPSSPPPSSPSAPVAVTLEPVATQPASAPVRSALEIPTVLPPVVLTPEEEPNPPSSGREPRSVSAGEPQIPEPLGAGVWLGVGTGVLAGGGLLAAVRRRLSRARDTGAASEDGID